MLFMSKNNQQIFATLSFLKVILEHDSDVREIHNMSKIATKICEVSDDSDTNKSLIYEKNKLYEYLVKENYGKQSLISIVKKTKLTMLSRYYDVFAKMYYDFADKKGEHIPVLFVSESIRYMRINMKLNISQDVFNGTKTSLNLKKKSNLENDEILEYVELVKNCFEKLQRIKKAKK